MTEQTLTSTEFREEANEFREFFYGFTSQCTSLLVTGRKPMFWSDPWLGGRSIKDLALHLIHAVPPQSQEHSHRCRRFSQQELDAGYQRRPIHNPSLN